MSTPGNLQPWSELGKGIWQQNPILVSVLGLCPAMAVTNSLMNALVMGVATTFVLVGSSTLISALRRWVPQPVRISLFIIVIATFVTSVDFTLAALLPRAHAQLGAFISLIVVNCLILGRQEAYASKQPVWLSIADAAGMGLGFTLALSAIGAVRELLGTGALLGASVFGPAFEPWAVMVLPPGGFFSLTAMLILVAKLERRRAVRARASEAPPPVSPTGRFDG